MKWKLKTIIASWKGKQPVFHAERFPFRFWDEVWMPG